MWALFKFKKCKCLKELVLEDGIGGKLQKTFIYKLSENGVLKLFHKIIFVSSPKDQYVPSYSARVQVNAKIEADTTTGPLIESMVKNIISQFNSDQLIRMTIDNNSIIISPPNNHSNPTTGNGMNADVMSNVNSMIGRTAHICYLENSIVATQIVLSLYPFLI
eukprot:gene13166-17639_t